MSPLPASFRQAGFVSPAEVRKTRRLLIGSDGPPDTGKTEFALSAPGPGLAICLDRGFDPIFDNPNPPETRQPGWAFKVVQVPKPTQLAASGYIEYWKDFYNNSYLPALSNPDCRSILIDGDSDSWELQRLAEFGKLTKIPSILYDNVNAARRAMYARAFDSGKIIIATNKVSKHYVQKFKLDGTPELNNSGNEVRAWDGTYERKGFADQDYLWNIQLSHKFKPAGINSITKRATPAQWGILITKCKANRELEGTELWGADACFQVLVQLVYPNVSLKDWGY